jgi:hypothetical protein
MKRRLKPMSRNGGGAQTWHPFETAKIPEIMFRTLLTESGPGQLVLARA